MNRLIRKTIKLIIATALMMSGSLVHAGEDSIVTTSIEGAFPDVVHSVRTSILGKGINIAHVLPASEMLHRTGAAFGYKNDVYLHAQTFEFCSAQLSHKLARISPENIVMCPFTISVYTLSSKPNQVQVSYRIPSGKPGSEKVVEEIVALLQGIVEDASW